MRNVIGMVGVGSALLVGALGLVISFVPGAQVGWFGGGAVSAAVGLVSERRGVRRLAAVLVLGLSLLAWDGYRQGVWYQESLRELKTQPPPGGRATFPSFKGTSR